MAEHESECRRGKKVFAVFMRVTDRTKSKIADTCDATASVCAVSSRGGHGRMK
jgi:hypothetical protein